MVKSTTLSFALLLCLSIPAAATVTQLPLDEGQGTTAFDASGNGNDGSLVGGPMYEAGTGDNSAFALRLDGVDDRIELGGLDVTGTGLTLASWFQADSFPGGSRDPRLISKATGTAANDHVFMLGTIASGSATRLRARVRVGGTTATLIASSGNLTTGVWYHAAATYDGAVLRLYLDGVEVGSSALSGAVDVAPGIPVAAGAQPVGNTRYFDGLIDDVRILDRALTLSELAAIVSGNQVPVAIADDYSVDEDAVLTVDALTGVLANDTDGDLEPLQAALVDDVTNGTLALSLDGSFSYTPAADFAGTDSFTYEADDGAARSAVTTVTLTVVGVNDAPVAVADSYVAQPGLVLEVDAATGVLANDSDADDDGLIAALVSNVTNGMLMLDVDGSFDYEPNDGFSGTDSFTYQADDTQALSATVTVELVVAVAPTAVADVVSTAEDVPVTGNVLSNDIDNEAPSDLVASLVSGPGQGTLSNFAADGSFTYVPNADYAGVDSFSYAATDGVSGGVSQATVTVTITPVNDAPVAVADSYAMTADTTLMVDALSGVLANDSDVEGDGLTAVLIDEVTSGALTLDPDGGFQYTPMAGFVGSVSFSYQADDAQALSDVETVSLQVSPNQPPGLVVQLPLDEGSGAIALDASGNGNDGSLIGGPAYETGTADNTAFALRLDGADDRVNLGSLDVAGTGLTLATWFQADSFPGGARDPRLISKASSTAANDHVFMLSTIASGSATRLRARLRVGGVTTTLVATSGNLNTATWYHAALTHDGGVMRLYLDGVEVGSTPLAGSVDVDPAVPVAIGAQPLGGTRYFDGLMDDVRILERALSAAEVQAIAAGNQAPLAAADSYATDEDVVLTVDVANGVLANDSDADQDSLQAILTDDVANGTLSLSLDGSFVYTPEADFSGTDGFTYQANDGAANSVVASVTLAVAAVNDVPTALPESYQVTPGLALMVDAQAGVLANDDDADEDELTAVLTSGVANGMLELIPDGSFSYEPLAGFSGIDSFTYAADDGQSASVPVTVDLIVILPPTALDDAVNTAEDVPVVGNVLTNDIDNQAPADLTASLAAGPSHGVLSDFATDGSFTYVPNADYAGLDSFSYSATDGVSGASAQATVTVTIAAVNDAPVAAGDSYTVITDTVLVVDAPAGVLANDTDAEDDNLLAVLAEDVSGGTLALSEDGSFQYTPAPDFVGGVTFTYQADDGLLVSTVQSVMIEVLPDLDPSELARLPLDEGQGTTAFDASGNGNDGSLVGGPMYEAGTGDNSAFALRLDGVDDRIELGGLDVTGTGLTLASWFQADSFPGGSRDPRLISKATGTAANDHVFMLGTIASGSATRLRARVRVGGTTATLIASSGNLTTGVWYHAAATYDGAVLRLYLDGVEVGSSALSGAVDVAPGIPVAAGAQPVGNTRYFDGLIDDVRILDRALTLSELAAIVSGNQVPVAIADDYSVDEDAVLTVDALTGVLANDTDGDLEPLQAALVDDVTNGTLALSLDGSFSYTPAADFAGTDSFTYEADDGAARSAVTTVTLTVVGVNDAPVAVADSYVAQPGLVLEVDAATGVLANDSDADDDGLIAALVSNVTNGMLMLDVDGSFDYEPNDGFSGTDSFTYQADDTQALSATVTVELVVAVAPTAVADVVSTAEDVPVTGNVLSNDIDNEAPSDLVASLVSGPGQGTLSNFAADGSFTYVPNADYAGVDSFSYAATDGVSGGVSQATVTVTITPVNDAPVAVADSYAMTADTTLMVDALSGVLANDSDVEGDGLTAVLIDEVTSGALTLDPDGGFQYTPMAGFVGSVSFSYQADDAQALSDVETVAIVVGGSDEPPTLETGFVGFSRDVVGTNIVETHFAEGADLDGDSDIDLIATDFINDTVYWFENDGSEIFVKRVIDGDLDGAYPAHLGDVDLDGDVDLLAGGYNADALVWYENSGSGTFVKRVIDAASDGIHSMVIVDIDEDGDIDLVTSSQDSGVIAWYENDGFQNFSIRVIDPAALGAKRAEFADIDGDGDIDVVSASNFSDEVAWYQNDGNENFSKRIVDDDADGAYFVYPVDIDGDQSIDLIAAIQNQNTVVWYRNDGAGNYTETIVDTSAIRVRSVVAADLDGDGDSDIIAASPDDNTVAWYENDGSGAFIARAVDQTVGGAYGITVVDVDRDMKLDVLSAGVEDDTVSVHYQRREHAFDVAIGEELFIDESMLRASAIGTAPAQLVYQLQSAPVYGELRLSGVALAANDTFSQADIEALALTYVQAGTSAPVDVILFDVTSPGGMSARGTLALTSVDPSDLKMQLEFENGIGQIAVDSTGNANDGSLLGGPGYEAQTIDGSAFAMRLDGSDDRIEVAGLDAGTNGLTLALWFKADTVAVPNQDARLISKATGVLEPDHVFMLSLVPKDGGTRLRARLRVSGVTETLIAPLGNVQVGEWHHAALTHNGKVTRLYLDGVLVGSTLNGGPVDSAPQVLTGVGSQPSGAGSNHFNGLLDDVRVYDRGLSEAEIIDLYSSAIDPGQPLTPAALTAVPLSTTRIELHWAASVGAGVSFDVLRDGVLIGNTATTRFEDNSAMSGVLYEYEVLARNLIGELSEAATVSASPLDPNDGGWWDADWSYRVLLTAASGDLQRNDRILDLPLNLTQKLAETGISGSVDTSTLRCHEVDVVGTILTLDVPCQFDPAPGFEAATFAAGSLSVLATGVTAERSARYFHLYFDLEGGASVPAPALAPRVSVVEDVLDEGQLSFEVTIENAVLYFQKEAGGFSSLLDADGNDWINYRPTGGSSGSFRGIPNLVFPEGHFHPGATNATSTLETAGPLKASIRSETSDGLWETLWEFYPDYARLTVTKADKPYWFLYEGTPGGVLDVASDFMIRSDASSNLLGQSWNGDLADEEWVLVVDPVLDRSLFVSHHEDDLSNDSYFPLNAEMTVLGFGRQNLISSIDQVPGTFSLGFSNATTHTAGKALVDEVTAPFQVFQSPTVMNGSGNNVEVTDDFAVDGPLQGYVVNNESALPDVAQVDGRYRALVLDNTNDVTLHFNDSQGRLDAKLVSFPFEYIAYNIGIGTQADSQQAPNSLGSPFMFAGVQVHALDLNSRNSAHVVVGHRGATSYTIEGKNTVDGVSSVSDDGANIVPFGRADIRVVGMTERLLEVYWRQPSSSDPWIPYGGNGVLPGTAPVFGDDVYVGLITYAFRESSVPFVGTADRVALTGEVID